MKEYAVIVALLLIYTKQVIVSEFLAHSERKQIWAVQCTWTDFQVWRKTSQKETVKKQEQKRTKTVWKVKLSWGESARWQQAKPAD